MITKESIAGFRAYLGSDYFEEKDFSVMAQFIYEFIFVDSPEEERIGLFTDFILNFWTDLMPRTDLVYHKTFEDVSDESRLELERKMDGILRTRFKEMQEIRRMSCVDFAGEAFEFIRSLERMEAVFAIFILLTDEKYTPYRHVDVDIAVSPERARDMWLQRPWNKILGLMDEFPDGKTIPACRRLMGMLDAEPDAERRVILLYLMFAAVVYLTREIQLVISVEEGADVAYGFRDSNKAYYSDCVAAIKQVRNGDRKFRHEFDQASYFLGNISRFDPDKRHYALYVALLAFHHQTMIGRRGLPNVKILPFTFN